MCDVGLACSREVDTALNRAESVLTQLKGEIEVQALDVPMQLPCSTKWHESKLGPVDKSRIPQSTCSIEYAVNMARILLQWLLKAS